MTTQPIPLRYPRPSSVEKLQDIGGQLFGDSTELTGQGSDATQILQFPEITMTTMRALVESLIKALWRSIGPRRALSLRPGEIRRLNSNLLVEKTLDGKIILYEVIEQWTTNSVTST